MAVWFLIFLDQICPKWIKLEQLDFWWNNHWNILSDFQPYIFFIRLNQICQNGSEWIKLDQNRSNLISDEIIIVIYIQIYQQYSFFDQIYLDLFKMDQTWTNWISDEIIVKIYHQIFNFIYFLIRLNQMCPKWFKMDQTWSN